MRRLLRPICWLLGHRWGEAARRMYASFPQRMYTQRYCGRCRKATWS